MLWEDKPRGSLRFGGSWPALHGPREELGHGALGRLLPLSQTLSQLRDGREQPQSLSPASEPLRGLSRWERRANLSPSECDRHVTTATHTVGCQLLTRGPGVGLWGAFGFSRLLPPSKDVSAPLPIALGPPSRVALGDVGLVPSVQRRHGEPAGAPWEPTSWPGQGGGQMWRSQEG